MSDPVLGLFAGGSVFALLVMVLAMRGWPAFRRWVRGW
jgi:hypothetical protein